MATGSFGFACRSHLPGLRAPPPFIYCARKVRRTSVVAVETLVEPESNIKDEAHVFIKSDGRGNLGKREVTGGANWKKLNAKDLGITPKKISKPIKEVLNGLRGKVSPLTGVRLRTSCPPQTPLQREPCALGMMMMLLITSVTIAFHSRLLGQIVGFEVYLVGGCVRDLILNRTPKDFDILTTAELRQVVRTFPNIRCEIVGRLFPICHVHANHTIVEVSSFSTTSRRKSNSNVANFFARPPDCDALDYRRWINCLGRDFTINGLMFDPYAKLVYDYMGGMEDIRKAKVRTVIPADKSFREDCARILRAVRIAARLGFRFSKETAYSIKELSCSILRLDKGRLLMEMNYMLAFGSAEGSLRLLWKVGLLEILLPIQAAYFVSQGFRRRDKRSNMLLSLFSSLDKLTAPDRPCHSSLWVAILGFHKAISDHPRDPLVVAVFTLALYNGGDLVEAVKIARSISQSHDHNFPELLDIQEQRAADVLIDEVKNLTTSVRTSLSMMIDESIVSQAMAKYPQAPYSDLVFISPSLYLRAFNIFDCVKREKKSFRLKQWKDTLFEDKLQEVRQIFARVVFDTVYPLHSKDDGA